MVTNTLYLFNQMRLTHWSELFCFWKPQLKGLDRCFIHMKEAQHQQLETMSRKVLSLRALDKLVSCLASQISQMCVATQVKATEAVHRWSDLQDHCLCPKNCFHPSFYPDSQTRQFMEGGSFCMDQQALGFRVPGLCEDGAWCLIETKRKFMVSPLKPTWI